MKRGVEAMADLRRSIEESRKSPYLAERIDEGMAEYRKMLALALKCDVPETAIAYARSCVETLRSLWELFDFLEECNLDERDAETNDHLAEIALEESDDEAVAMLVAKEGMPLERMALFIEGHKDAARVVNYKPLATRFAAYKLRQLHLRIGPRAKSPDGV